MSEEPVDSSCNLWRRLGELQPRLQLTDADYTDTTKVEPANNGFVVSATIVAVDQFLSAVVCCSFLPYPRNPRRFRVHPRQSVVALLPAHTEEFA